ncbi:solute carrier family 22 member 6-A-like [Ambystoma mexicanum]|uniref:solute carrier family 22 member 6-A-like n=1 Tax=Ambystoma mexicanum TaxID=8296 RepID=UPI0037E98858
MAFADLLDVVGGMGRFQFIQVSLLAVPILMMASHNLLQNFSAGIPTHHCRVAIARNGSHDTNTSLAHEDFVRATIPMDRNQRPEKCLQFTEPQWWLLIQNATADNVTAIAKQPCADGWDYDRSVFVSTIITEWDLVCDQRTMRQLAQSIFMAGVLAGAIVFGGLSDKFGRRPILIWSYFQMAASGTCAAYSPNFIAYCVFRFLTGMALSGIGLDTVSLIVEWIPTRVRTITGTLTGYFYTFGQIVLAGLAYGLPNWRHLQLTISVPFFFFFLYSWWIPESARWLVLAGKPEKAVKVLKRVATLNGKKEEGDKISVESLKIDLLKETAASTSSYSVIDLVRTRNIRRITICISFVWFSTSFAYYGLAMDLQNFGVSVYLIQVIFGAVDIPAKLMSTIAMSYIGRRITQAASLTLAGTAIIANIFIPYEFQTLRTSMAVMGKGCLASSFSCAFLFTSELYPTVIRQSGLGYASTMARVGGIVAPMVKITSEYVPFLPLVIYGGAALISGFAACFLPETLNEGLPDTIEEVENRRKKVKPETKDKAATTKEKALLQSPVSTTC